MQWRAFLSPERSRGAWLLVAVVAATSSASGAEPQATSREEIVGRWDLDGNGTIDEAEAALARNRMRRARLEIEAQSGIDPLTGRPRGAAEEPAPADEPPVEPPPPPPRRRTSDDPPLPGTRVPDVKRPDAPQDPARPPSSPTIGPPRREPAPSRGGSGTASPASPGGPLTGGVRAGAPAARPGYGARVPFSTLDSGRSRVAPGSTPAAAARPESGRMSGGLVPRPLPATTPGGSRRGGSNAGRPLVNPPPAPPVPTLPKPPRVTAEDIGGG